MLHSAVLRRFDGRRREWRRTRLRWMVELLRLPPGARVVDLGGVERDWHLIDAGFHVTLVNLPGEIPPVSDPSRFASVEGDACDLSGRFGAGAFDAVYSNSVIEHVGGEARQEAFAAEVRRLAPAYWVQTPSPRFPLEVHTGIPGYWSLPAPLRAALLDRWQRRYPAWAEMLRATRVLSRRRMRALFPDAEVKVERFLGVEKSFCFYRPYPAPR